MGLTVGSVLKNILQNEVARDLGFILKKIPGIEARGALCINLERDTLAGDISLYTKITGSRLKMTAFLVPETNVILVFQFR